MQAPQDVQVHVQIEAPPVKHDLPIIVNDVLAVVLVTTALLFLDSGAQKSLDASFH